MREQRSNFNYVSADFVSQFGEDLYHLYAEDTATRIKNFKTELQSAKGQGGFRNQIITLRDFRYVNLVKKEDLIPALQAC